MTIPCCFYFPGNLDTLRSQPTPRIESPEQVFRAQVGETLVLPCQVSNLGTYVLMWKQEKRVLTAGTLVVRKDFRIHLRDDFALELQQLKPDDQGTYTCEIDVMGKPLSIQHTVSYFLFFLSFLYCIQTLRATQCTKSTWESA